MGEPISLRAYARHRRVSAEAVSKAIAVGRLTASVTLVDGAPKIANAALADEEWARNTRPRVDHPRRATSRPHKQWVYFIQCTAGPIKIGVAVDVEERLRTLQCGSPFELRLIARVPGGYDLEADLHRRLCEHRLHGEWFANTPVVLRVLEEVTQQ